MITYRQPFRGAYPITQQYGELIPGVTYNNKPHTGIDYGCPMRTPVLASADGTVMAAGWDRTGYGFRVIIKHGGPATLYAHLDSISVSPGEQVKQGQEIGLSGMSGGTSTGPHLHFEARRTWNDYGSHFDPMLLPLMSFADLADDSAGDPETTSQELSNTWQKLEPGIYRVACSAAYVRSWDQLIREKIVQHGDLVYVFGDHREQGGLTFYFIGAGSAMAAADGEGTVILEKYNGEK